MRRVRLIALLLALSMIFVLTACNNDDAPETENENENVGTEVTEDDHHDEDDHDHEHGEFEWMGEYDLVAGVYTLKFEIEEDHEHLDVGMVEVTDQVADLEHQMLHVMEIEEADFVLKDGDSVDASSDYLMEFELNKGASEISFSVAEDGKWALGLEHSPEEVGFKLLLNGEEVTPVAEHEGAVHAH